MALINNSSLSQHVSHLEQVFQCLLENQFYLKLSKCLFAQRQLEYLRHIIFVARVLPEPSKIQAILAWPPPSNREWFLLKVCRTICHYFLPLMALLHKDAFAWTLEAQHAFDALKEAVTRALDLALPDFPIAFTVDTDASGTTMATCHYFGCQEMALIPFGVLICYQYLLAQDTTPLPLEAFNHRPIIRPLAILDTHMDNSTDPPTKMVVVQWFGLSPDDTSWEKWASSNYHLGDKVIFPGTDIVSKQTIAHLNNARPKRIIITLAHVSIGF
ncbi:hypothetical protein V8G54_032094 [Vigna mungo]|uniref:Reverse transcriptase/retrotransposon-derived protein RNase H-like domain-containing protein n=1 Tax=Vigna mungo TaxID=3915 RepID=A0AAQ3MLC3_VIGMU